MCQEGDFPAVVREDEDAAVRAELARFEEGDEGRIIVALPGVSVEKAIVADSLPRGAWRPCR